jgi:hypothetical protein
MAPFHPYRPKFNTLTPQEKRRYGMRFTRFLRSLIKAPVKIKITDAKQPRPTALRGPTGKPSWQILKSVQRTGRKNLSLRAVEYLKELDGTI